MALHPSIRASDTAQALPLEAGDHLTRAEFERRYEACPDLKKAELVEGVVYMPSPVRADMHAGPHALLMTWLGAFAVRTPGVDVLDNATVRLDLDNEPQPDASLRIIKGGQSTLSLDGYVLGPTLSGRCRPAFDGSRWAAVGEGGQGRSPLTPR